MDSQTPKTLTQAGMAEEAIASDETPAPSNPEFHEVVVNLDRGNSEYNPQTDPIFIIRYPSFQLAPLVTTSSNDSGPVEYTLVGDVPEVNEPDAEPGSTR